jgi:hypothetical protein
MQDGILILPHPCLPAGRLQPSVAPFLRRLENSKGEGELASLVCLYDFNNYWLQYNHSFYFTFIE